MINTARSTYPAILKLISILELLPFFHQIFKFFNTFHLIFQKLSEIDVKFKLQNCAAYQDLPTLQFWSKSHYPFWSYCPFLAHLVFRPCELLPSLLVRPSTFHILIFSSETTGPIATKLWWNGPWMAPFQNCVRWSRLPTKMAAKLKLGKRGDENFKMSFPLKLLSQSQPNFTEMILGWSHSKTMSGISDLRPRWPPQPNLI